MKSFECLGGDFSGRPWVNAHFLFTNRKKNKLKRFVSAEDYKVYLMCGLLDFLDLLFYKNPKLPLSPERILNAMRLLIDNSKFNFR